MAEELFALDRRVPDDPPQKSTTNVFPSMNRHYGSSSVCVTEDEMTAVLRKFDETKLVECFRDFSSRQGG